MWKFAQYFSKYTNAYSHKLLAALCSTVSLYQTLPVNKTHATRISYGFVYGIWTLDQPYLTKFGHWIPFVHGIFKFSYENNALFLEKFYSNFDQGFEVK